MKPFKIRVFDLPITKAHICFYSVTNREKVANEPVMKRRRNGDSSPKSFPESRNMRNNNSCKQLEYLLSLDIYERQSTESCDHSKDESEITKRHFDKAHSF